MGGVSIGLIVFLSACFYFLIFLQLVLLAWLNIYTALKHATASLSAVFPAWRSKEEQKSFWEKKTLLKKKWLTWKLWATKYILQGILPSSTHAPSGGFFGSGYSHVIVTYDIKGHL